MHGEDAFVMEQIGSATTHKEANNLEKLWIILLDCCNPILGYNLTYGGEGGEKTAECRAAHRAKLRGRKSSPEVRAKISESLRRAYREGARKSNKGMKMPDSMCQAASERMRTNHPQQRIDVTVEEVVRMRQSGMYIREIAAELGVSSCTVERRCKQAGIVFPKVKRPDSEETRLKKSAASSGRKLSPETREKIRQLVTEQWAIRKQNDPS
jgi:hypothetical protein